MENFIDTIVFQELKNIQRRVKYCAKCYKEFNETETIYYNMETFSYLCFDCALELSSNETKKEEDEEREGLSLF
ncbi:MAG: hypothetical protein GXO02_01700 [Epsilonproteobacteria bacterium]|nr:hypothetical protein [Campylobacterota bacterium]